MSPEGFRPSPEYLRLSARVAELEEENDRLRRLASRPNALVLDDGLQYKEVFDNISACMFVVDVTANGRFKFVNFNSAEEEAVGLTTAQVAGRFVEEVFDTELANQLIISYRHTVEAGKPIHFDSDLDLPAGKRSFHTNLIPLRDGAGQVYRIVGACIDITDFKKAQNEALARQRLEGLGLLAGGVAHDFGNLLSSVLMEAEVVRANLEHPAARNSIDTIRNLAIQAGEIVRVLMAYAGREKPVFERVDICSLVAETIQALAGTLSKYLILKTDLPANVPPIWGNPAQIRQVIMNLLTNASDALGSQEGVIHVRLSKTRIAADSAGGTMPKQAPFIRLEVRDSGCGMSEDVQARMFDPFYTTKPAGRGLGLACVQGIVHAHGGSIQVVSSLGKGSRVDVLLPVIVEPSATKTHAKRLTKYAPGAAHRTVLLIEDEPLLRNALARLLDVRGFRVTVAADGSEALDIFRADPSHFDIVLLDMTLPHISGLAVFQELRRIRPDIKIVVSTAYSEEHVFAAIRGEQNWQFIRKPYPAARVYDVMQDLLGMGQCDDGT